MRQHRWSPTQQQKQNTTVHQGGRFCSWCGRGDGLERHHVPPQCMARKLGLDRWTILLCAKCHDAVHMIWGPGDNWVGPMTTRGMREALRQVPHVHVDDVLRRTAYGARLIAALRRLSTA